MLSAPPPVHPTLTRAQVAVSALSLVAACALLAALAFRLTTQMTLWQWWVPLALLAGCAAADFGSGLIHWSADTWGRDDLPIIGRRLLVPFRVHHINPDDFCQRRFVDTNGEVAGVAVPVLLGLLAVPLDRTWGHVLAVTGLGFCAIGMMTNQIHQWTHLPSPPRPIRALQACHLILGRAEHAVHHERPYDARYCITTGWCNRPLEAIGFFRRLETAIARLTGAQPRRDDRRYEERHGVPVPSARASRHA